MRHLNSTRDQGIFRSHVRNVRLVTSLTILRCPVKRASPTFPSYNYAPPGPSIFRTLAWTGHNALTSWSLSDPGIRMSHFWTSREPHSSSGNSSWRSTDRSSKINFHFLNLTIDTRKRIPFTTNSNRNDHRNSFFIRNDTNLKLQRLLF